MNVTIYVRGCLGCYIFNITGQISVSNNEQNIQCYNKYTSLTI